MPAAVRKMPTETESAPPDDPRAALRAAKNLAWRATCALTSAQDAVQRGQELVASIEAKLAEATETIKQAEKSDSETAAKAISHRDVLGVPGAMREARKHQDELTERLALAQSALAELQEQLPHKELALAVARNAVIVARNVLLAPVAAAALERIKARRIEQLRDRVLLSRLISDNGAPEFSNDASAFFPAREAEVARRQAFGAVRAEAAADAADLALVPPTHNIEEAELVMEYHHRWTGQLAALLENPDAELPEIV
jgi:hypothetical protein